MKRINRSKHDLTKRDNKKLFALFPNVIKVGKVDFELLKNTKEIYINKNKMISIYLSHNTEKIFIYKDGFLKSEENYESQIEAVDEEEMGLLKNSDSNERFHSDWLSMVSEKLFDINSDRNDFDLFFKIILNVSVELTLGIEMKVLAVKKVYFVENNLFVACFDNNIDETFAEILTKGEEKPLEIVLKNRSFRTDSDKINFEEIIKELSPESKIWVV